MNDEDTMLTVPQGTSACTVLICTTDDGNDVGELIYESLEAVQSAIIIENLSKTNAVCSVAHCTVFVPILTPQVEQNLICRAAFEKARLLNKRIIPVIALPKWRPDGWLGLIIAGRVFFRIFDKETAYKPFYDSNRVTDLRVEIEVSKCLHCIAKNFDIDQKISYHFKKSFESNLKLMLKIGISLHQLLKKTPFVSYLLECQI